MYSTLANKERENSYAQKVEKEAVHTFTCTFCLPGNILTGNTLRYYSHSKHIVRIYIYIHCVPLAVFSELVKSSQRLGRLMSMVRGCLAGGRATGSRFSSLAGLLLLSLTAGCSFSLGCNRKNHLMYVYNVRKGLCPYIHAHTYT